MSISGNIQSRLLRVLAERLPSRWRILPADAGGKRASTDRSGESALKIRAPSGKTGLLLVQTKERLEPKDVDFLAPHLRMPGRAPVIIAAPFLSVRTQERLKASGLGYADLTGNIHLSVSEPGLFIETTGAAENPFSTRRERKSLRGRKAGRLIRALCDLRPPIGIRELAKRAGIDAGYTSRLIHYLDREALVTRPPRGAITRSDWAGLIKRWSQEYTPFEHGRVTWYLAPRGLEQVFEPLKALSMRYALSGSWAAAQFAPVSPTRLLLCYTDDPAGVARALDIRPAEAGANIALVTPFDAVVYERTMQRGGITITAVSQTAADLLGSPGRGPNEAEALMEWMRTNELTWR